MTFEEFDALLALARSEVEAMDDYPMAGKLCALASHAIYRGER